MSACNSIKLTSLCTLTALGVTAHLSVTDETEDLITFPGPSEITAPNTVIDAQSSTFRRTSLGDQCSRGGHLTLQTHPRLVW